MRSDSARSSIRYKVDFLRRLLTLDHVAGDGEHALPAELLAQGLSTGMRMRASISRRLRTPTSLRVSGGAGVGTTGMPPSKWGHCSPLPGNLTPPGAFPNMGGP